MESEGIYSKLKRTQYVYKPFTLDEFKKVINDLVKNEDKNRDDRIILPAQYLLACSDKEFIRIYNKGKDYKIMPCGSDTIHKIQERVKKLIK